MNEISRTAAAPGGAVGRGEWSDFAKGVAMLMVIYYHASLYLQHYGVDGVLGRAKAAFELFPMPIFFLISGLLGWRMTSWTFRQLWQRRLAPILYLYVLWSVIRAVFYFVIPGLNGELGELPATDPRSLALVLVWPSSSYWFLYALVVFTLVGWLIRKVPPWLSVGAAAIISTLFSMGVLNAHNIGWNRVGGLFVFFIAGICYSKQITALVARANLVHAAVMFAVFVGSSVLLLLGWHGIPFLALAGEVAVVAFGLILSKYLARVRWLSFVPAIGAESLKVYILHLYIIVPTAALIGLLHPDWPRAIDFAVMIIVVTGTATGSFYLGRLTSRVHWLYVPPRRLTGGPVRSADPSRPSGPRRRRNTSAATANPNVRS